MNWRGLLGVGGALVLLGSIYLGAAVLHGRPSRAPSSTPTTSVPSAATSDAFHLIDQDGRAVDEASLRGKPSLLFFGYTYCPDICPTTLARMTAWMKALGPDADRINVAFVTIDPERDTPKQLKLYLSSFDSRIRGLTGSAQAIDQAAHEYNVYYQKVPTPGGGYAMDHSSGIYLLDRQGRQVEQLMGGEDASEALASIRRALKG